MAAPTLIVFADDWGRHPSSAQHLVRHLLPHDRVVWVNTLGTRRPRLAWGDLGKIGRRLWRWLSPRRDGDALPENLTVIAPRMWPGFRTPRQRRFNAKQITQAVERALSEASRPGSGRSPAPGSPGTGATRPGSLRSDVTVLTTLPITADLVETIRGRWVYYCVDDFSQWPGTDHAVMDAMERQLVSKVDAVVCVSEVLRERVGSMGRDAALLTHGVDVEHWRQETPLSLWWTSAAPRPVFLFWGLLDERMEAEWWWDLIEAGECTPVTVGPRGPQCELGGYPNHIMPGTVPYAELPKWAAWADVLVMPYVDAPVTRAMQPLKLLEYLATDKPVVVRDLPATRAWADCCDVVSTPEEFVRVCRERAATGLPEDQRAARQRKLPGESWASKAAALEAILRGDGPGAAAPRR